MAYRKVTIVEPLDSRPTHAIPDFLHEKLELGLVDKATKLPLKELPSDKARKTVTGSSRSYVSTDFHLYVPRPQKASHIPAVFIRISNGASAPVVCRLNPGDLEKLLSFLHIHQASCDRAYDRAVSHHSKVDAFERSLNSDLDSLNKSPSSSC